MLVVCGFFMDRDLAGSQYFFQRVAMRPKARTWVKHAAFLGLTVFTSTLAGVLYPFGSIDPFPTTEPETWAEIINFLLAIPLSYAAFIGELIYAVATHPDLLQQGLSFSLSLLFILLCHEMGHYIMCRRYGVDATLPFFIPTPPLIGPAGTFGAFMKIMSPMPSRKAVFDIGVAGPIAGFVALIPVTILAFVTASPKDYAASGDLITFARPLFMQLMSGVFGIELTPGFGNPFYFAAWVGLLVTALNLIPSGQLDGGHAIYSVFGKRVHYWTGRIAFVVMTTFSILGWIYFNSPSGFLIAVLLGVMMRIKHPEPLDPSPLDPGRRFVAFLTLVVFLLSFTPFPLKLL